MSASPELIIDGKSSQENIEGTHERVKQQVDKELQQLTNEIWKSFYHINEKWEVEYDTDLVKKYLETKKDKTYTELLKSQNTSAWIMTVQIALSSVGYDVGKVDWILRNKWAKTSRTMEQIVKFQKENWLKPDWKPGSLTITKLLEKLWPTTLQDWDIEKRQKEEKTVENNEENNDAADNVKQNEKLISKEKFEDLCFESELSDDEIRQVVDYANKEWWSWLSLRIKTIKNKNQLNELSKIKSALHLNRIYTIANEQLKSLSNVEWLSLWLKKITLDQAKIITSWKVKKLELENLDWWRKSDWSIKGSMSDEVAYELSKIDELHINSARLTDKQKEILKNIK